MPSCIENPSDQIRKKIKETGIKQVHLAKKLGISPQHLNKILSRNQEKSQYLSKMAEILSLDQSIVESDKIKDIPILSSRIIKSLSNGSISFEELKSITCKSWSTRIQEDYYFFAYKLTENISSQIIKKDLLIFSTCLPCDISGRIGIAFIKDITLVFVGKLKFNQKKIVIYNENACFEFKPEDQLLGVATYLERNI